MKKYEKLITLCRAATENSDFSSDTGIADEEFVQYFDNANKRLESLIQVNHPRMFTRTLTQTIAASSETIAIPADCYLRRLILVEWNSTGNDSNFYKIRKGSVQERFSGLSGDPSYYIPVGNEIILRPSTQSGGRIRWTYQKELPGADILRGEVLLPTVSSGVLSALTLSTTSSKAPIDQDALNEEDYLSVVDKDGVVKIPRLPISNVDETTGIVTLTSSYTLLTGESIAAGDFVCRGKNKTHISQLPDVCERYLMEYVNWRILRRDSNVDQAETSGELVALEKDILDSFKEPDSDVDYIPILDSSYLGVDDEVF